MAARRAPAAGSAGGSPHRSSAGNALIPDHRPSRPAEQQVVGALGPERPSCTRIGARWREAGGRSGSSRETPSKQSCSDRPRTVFGRKGRRRQAVRQRMSVADGLAKPLRSASQSSICFRPAAPDAEQADAFRPGDGQEGSDYQGHSDNANVSRLQQCRRCHPDRGPDHERNKKSRMADQARPPSHEPEHGRRHDEPGKVDALRRGHAYVVAWRHHVAARSSGTRTSVWRARSGSSSPG